MAFTMYAQYRNHEEASNYKIEDSSISANDIDVPFSMVSDSQEEMVVELGSALAGKASLGSSATLIACGDDVEGRSAMVFGNENSAGILSTSAKEAIAGSSGKVFVSAVGVTDGGLVDLLSASEEGAPLHVYTDVHSGRGVRVHNLTETLVTTANQAEETLAPCRLRESIHKVFTISIITDVPGKDFVKEARIVIVDLDSGAIPPALLKIVGGPVIDHEDAFRESTLTRLLKDALTSSHVTVALAVDMAAPVGTAFDFAARASRGRTVPSEERTFRKVGAAADYADALSHFQKQIQDVKAGGGEGDEGVANADEGIAISLSAQRAQVQEILDLKATIARMAEEAKAAKSMHTSAQVEVKNKSDALAAAQTKLEAVEARLSSAEGVIEEHQRAEGTLLGEAAAVTQAAEAAVSDVGKLHSKLERKTRVENENKQTLTHFRKSITEAFDDISGQTVAFKESHRASLVGLQAAFQQQGEAQGKDVDAITGALRALETFFSDDASAQASNAISQNASSTAKLDDVAAQGTMHVANINAEMASFGKEVAAVMARISAILGAWRDNTHAWEQAFEAHVQASLHATEEFVAAHAAALRDLHSDVGSSTAKLENDLATQRKALEDFERQQADQAATMKAEVMQQVKAILSRHLAAQQESVAGAGADMRATVAACVQANRQAHTDAAATVQRASASVASFGAAHTDATDSAVGASEKAGGAVQRNVACLSQDVFTMEETVDKFSADITASSHAYASATSEAVASEVAAVTTAKDATVAAEKERVAGASASIQSADDAAKAAESRAKDDAAAWSERIDGQQGAVNSYRDEQGKASADLASTTRSFSVQEDVPTGSTPSKKPYPAPTSLTRARDRDVVVQGVRESRSVAELDVQQKEAALRQREEEEKARAAAAEARRVAEKEEAEAAAKAPSPAPLAWGRREEEEGSNGTASPTTSAAEEGGEAGDSATSAPPSPTSAASAMTDATDGGDGNDVENDPPAGGEVPTKATAKSRAGGKRTGMRKPTGIPALRSAN